MVAGEADLSWYLPGVQPNGSNLGVHDQAPRRRPPDDFMHDDNERIAAALAWLADRAVPEPQPEPPEPRLSWGNDAARHPPEYWHWLHVRRLEGIDGKVRAVPPDGPLISVIVPVYLPEPWYFDACVRSVQQQTYPRWELCLCDDGSDDDELSSTLARLAAADSRVKVTALSANGGISKATNAALGLASGEFVALLDHDDVLEPDALGEVAAAVLEHDDADVLYTDDDKYDDLDRPFQPHFKPDWSPDLLLSYPYMGHLTVVRKSLLDDVGGFRPEFDGSQDYDVMLRVTERSRRIVHIPRVLYHWRAIAGSAALDAAAKPWAHAASRRVLEDAVRRQGIDGTVEQGPFPGSYRVRRHVVSTPTVSIIIPFRDQAAMTDLCLRSLGRTVDGDRTEIVLVDNGSSEPETSAARAVFERRDGARIIDHPGEFNWSTINNVAAATCRSELLLFLNNDIEAVDAGWLGAMIEQAVRPEVGAVGARLVYPNGVLQHTGVVVGLSGMAGHVLVGLPKGQPGYGSWDRLIRDYSAVTAACMLVRRTVFEELGGFDERLAVAFNDTDFCLRVRQAGYRVVSTPFAELVHHESVSRGLSGFDADCHYFAEKWSDVLRAEDPFYNRNLSRIVPWCALRFPGEDEEWEEMIGDATP
jgi:GT2 family glycosyltransferase